MKTNEKYNRIRPLKIWEILQRETDEDHSMGTEELRAKLLECGIEAHRTTIYEDIKLGCLFVCNKACSLNCI